MTMTDTRSQGSHPTPAAVLTAMDPDAFTQIVRDHLGRDADQAVWDALTDPSVIARTRSCLSALHADTQTQLAQANSRLDVIKAECLAMGGSGRQAFFDARAGQADWRQRTLGFRRLLERRMAFVKSCTAAIAAQRPPVQPGRGAVSRKHNNRALEELARAVAGHQERVTSGNGDEGDDDALWDRLDSITVMSDQREMPLREWLEFIDDRCVEENADA